MNEKFNNLIPLTISCLLDKPVANCPFCEIRKRPLSNRIALIKELEDLENDRLFKHHYECYMKRIKK